MIFTTIAGVNSIFFAEYKFPNHVDEPHVFTPIQQWAQNQKKRWFAENLPQSSELNGNSAILTTGPTTTAKNTADIDGTALSASKFNSNHNDNISELQRIAKGHR